MAVKKSGSEMKSCAWCGESFVATRASQKFCPGRSCSKQSSNSKQRKQALAEKSCEHCGTPFLPRKVTDKYCTPVCARTRINERRAVGGVTRSAPEVLGSLAKEDLVAELQSRGHTVVLDRPPERRLRLATQTKDKAHHRFAVCGDTHLGGKHQQLTHLNGFYDQVVKEGIDTVFHVGDLVHGSHKMHRDMPFELFVHGQDAQVDYATQVFPKRDGVRTYLISGNHDDSHYSDSGGDVCKGFTQNRDDVEYLGQRGAYIEYGDLSIYLWHPKGGLSYARSYKLQKWIESVSPESKPHIIFTGHFHVAAHLPAYRNVEGFLTPCFQGQTPYEKTLGLQPVVGGLLVDIWVSKDGLEDLQVRWCLNRIPVPNDW